MCTAGRSKALVKGVFVTFDCITKKEFIYHYYYYYYFKTLIKLSKSKDLYLNFLLSSPYTFIGRTHGAPYCGYGHVPLRFGGNVFMRMETQQQLRILLGVSSWIMSQTSQELLNFKNAHLGRRILNKGRSVLIGLPRDRGCITRRYL